MRWEEEKNKFPGFSLSLHQTSNFHNRSKPQDCFCTKSLNQKLENQKNVFLDSSLQDYLPMDFHTFQ